jgi:pre-mRNA-splicing factor CWC22
LAIKPELDLIHSKDQIAHYITLDDETLNAQEDLNFFSFDPKFAENESYYEELKKELAPQPVTSAQNEEILPEVLERKPESKVVDNTGSALTELRKVIYLTIMSCVDFEECGHKLLKLNIPIGFELEVCNMIVECCSQERTFLKYYGLLAERFCKLNLVWTELFTNCFQLVYSTIHRLETNKIRNVAKLFSHLLTSEALPPNLLSCITLSEDETTSSSRIFIKFLFQDLHEHYGMLELKKWVHSHLPTFPGLFPLESDRNVRFAYNFFVAIDLEPIVLFLKEKINE